MGQRPCRQARQDTLRFQIVPFDSKAGISTATASPVSSRQERAASLEYDGFGIVRLNRARSTISLRHGRSPKPSSGSRTSFCESQSSALYFCQSLAETSPRSRADSRWYSVSVADLIDISRKRELFPRSGATPLSDGARNAVCRSCELGSQIRVPGRHEAGRELVHRDAERVRALPRVNLLEILHAPA